MGGYLCGTRIGAVIYNAAHATPLPAVMTGLGWWQHRPLVPALGLIWLAHIGLDRLQGYGLKYDNSFQHTHLGMLGKESLMTPLSRALQTARPADVDDRGLASPAPENPHFK